MLLKLGYFLVKGNFYMQTLPYARIGLTTPLAQQYTNSNLPLAQLNRTIRGLNKNVPVLQENPNVLAHVTGEIQEVDSKVLCSAAITASNLVDQSYGSLYFTNMYYHNHPSVHKAPNVGTHVHHYVRELRYPKSSFESVLKIANYLFKNISLEILINEAEQMPKVLQEASRGLPTLFASRLAVDLFPDAFLRLAQQEKPADAVSGSASSLVFSTKSMAQQAQQQWHNNSSIGIPYFDAPQAMNNQHTVDESPLRKLFVYAERIPTTPYNFAQKISGLYPLNTGVFYTKQPDMIPVLTGLLTNFTGTLDTYAQHMSQFFQRIKP